MATLLITKKPSNEYSFIVNGNTSDEILNLRNDLTVVGNRCHFKTSNGANLIKEQNISFSDVTLVATGTFTFVSVYALFAKLREVGFFDWINGIGTIGGVTKFSALDDTFAYFGKAGKAVVVANDELRLETITIHNYRNFVDLEDTFDVIVPNKMLITNSEGTGIILRDIPQTQVDNLPVNNRIKTKTGFTLVGQDLTINPSWEWILQGINYTNVEAQVKTFPLAATGLQRIDYVVPNVSNGFDIVTGQESATPVAPQIPYEGMYVTFVLVTDASVVHNGEPDLSAYATIQYVDGKDVLKVDKVTGKSLLLDNEITRLTTLANYTHPANHPPSIITQDASNRFVTDAEKSTWNAKQSALGFTPENVANKNIASGYAGLGADGKLLSTQLPSITISDTFVVATEAAMLAVVADTGDVAVRTDLKKSFILKGINPAVLTDWQELLTPTSAVTSVNGFVGSVVLNKSDVGLSNVDNTSDLSKPISTAEQNALNLKANIASPTFTGVPSAPTATAGTNTTQLATTAFVLANAPVASLTVQANNTSTAYTLALSDLNTFIPFTNSAAVALTIPTNASVAFPIGGRIEISRQGVSNLTISGAGITFIAPNALIVSNLQTAFLTKMAVDSWKVTFQNYSKVGDVITFDTPVSNGRVKTLGFFEAPFFKVNATGSFISGFCFSDEGSGMVRIGSVNNFINYGNINSNDFLFNSTQPFGNDATGLNKSILQVTPTMTASSGNMSTSLLNLSPTINQTGTATGITRSLYINPTLTAASDFRAIEVVAGKVLIPNGTTGNEAVNFSQLSSKVSGTGTTNYLSKWTGTGTQGNSSWQESVTGTRLFNGIDDGINKLQVTGVIKTSTSTGEFFRSDATSLGASQVMVAYNSDGVRRLLFGYGSTNSESLMLSNDLNGDILVRTNALERMNISSGGIVKINNLSGTGSRVVTADTSGNLSATTALDSRPYKVYTALLTQSGTTAPVATVLENNLGLAVVWSRTGIGSYNATITGGFNQAKTFLTLNNLATTNGFLSEFGVSSSNVLLLKTGSGTSPSDDVLLRSPLEIRVYN